MQRQLSEQKNVSNTETTGYISHNETAQPRKHNFAISIQVIILSSF